MNALFPCYLSSKSPPLTQVCHVKQQPAEVGKESSPSWAVFRLQPAVNRQRKSFSMSTEGRQPQKPLTAAKVLSQQ